MLLSLGLKPEECHGSLRVTLGRSNTMEEVDYVAAGHSGGRGEVQGNFGTGQISPSEIEGKITPWEILHSHT